MLDLPFHQEPSDLLRKMMLGTGCDLPYYIYFTTVVTRALSPDASSVRYTMFLITVVAGVPLITFTQKLSTLVWFGLRTSSPSDAVYRGDIICTGLEGSIGRDRVGNDKGCRAGLVFFTVI